MRIILLCLLLLAPVAHAAEPGVLGLLPADAVTHHMLPGTTPLPYTATAGTLPLFDQSGAHTASVFYTAYVAEGPDRPVTHSCSTAGPGAASAYLHLGLVGPMLLRFGQNGRSGSDASLTDNPQSWLAFTDLVLVDPIGTGWSRTAKPDDASHFWGVREDASVLAKVVALWLAHNGRTAARKFLLGESYGGLRVAKLAAALQDEQGIVVHGLLMISPLLEGALTFSGDRMALGAALKLPSLAASELDRTGRFTPAALANAENFALGDYLHVLAGTPPTGDAARDFYGRVAAMTGLEADVVARTQGFLGRAVLHPPGGQVSAYDGTFGIGDSFGDRHGDPVLDGVTRAYGGAFVGYARDTLGFRTDMTFELLDEDVSRHWNWHSESGALSLPGVTDDLRALLAFDPGLRVLVASGRDDLITPYAAARYVLAHIAAAPRVAQNIYPGGHMLYLNDASRQQFTADARDFIAATLRVNAPPP